MSLPLQPEMAVPCGCRLGEGPLWDHRTGTLYWVDIHGQALWALGDELATRTELDERTGFVLLTPDSGVLIAGMKTGLRRIEAASGRVIETVCVPEPDCPWNRCNDGVASPDGQVFFGTMDDDEEQPTGAFYRHDGMDLHRFADGLGTTNGPAVSPDGKLLYTVDSSARIVSRAPMQGGAPGGAEAFLRFGPDDATPDGIAVDEEGWLWIAHHGGGRVTRFTPEGVAERVVTLPVARPTKCAFAGPDLTTLFITTAGGGRPGPSDGHLFRIETGIRGLPAAIARI